MVWHNVLLMNRFADDLADTYHVAKLGIYCPQVVRQKS